MNDVTIPPVIQAIGLACVPLHEIAGGDGAAGRRPVAAAVVTLTTRDDGHRAVVASCVSDARDLEFPLPWLTAFALLSDAVTTQPWSRFLRRSVPRISMGAVSGFSSRGTVDTLSFQLTTLVWRSRATLK